MAGIFLWKVTLKRGGSSVIVDRAIRQFHDHNGTTRRVTISRTGHVSVVFGNGRWKYLGTRAESLGRMHAILEKDRETAGF